MKRKIIFILSFIFFFSAGNAQSLPDSLKTILQKAATDTAGFHRMLETVSHLIVDRDTVKRDLFIREGLKVAEQKGFEEQFLEQVALAYEKSGEYFLAVEYFQKELEAAIDSKNQQLISYVYKQLGNQYYNMGDFAKSLDNFFKSLRIREEIHDSAGASQVYLNIGNIYFKQDDYGKASQYYQKSQEIEESKNNQNGMASCYLNIGQCYEKRQAYDTALNYYQRGLDISKKANNQLLIASSLINIANIYNSRNVSDSAKACYERALSIYESLGEGQKPKIADTYLSMGLFYQSNLEYRKAEECYTKAYDLSRELRSYEIYMNAALGLSQVYARLGLYEKAYDFQLKYKEAEEIVKNTKNQKEIAQREMKYLLDKKTDEQIAEKKRQTIVVMFFVVALAFMIILAVVIFRSYTRKKHDNILLNEQKEEIATQRDEIEAQRDQVTHQRDQIQKQKEEITDSILYARRIQNAILPPEEFRNAILREHFILNKPRDIVSGDFYWLASKGDKIVAAVADCTGHGVPGAFMSMLGVSFLNEIVNKGDAIQPGMILDLLRENIIRALHQTGKEGENKDGMDISLVVIDQNAGKIEFAGAYNSLYVIRDGEVLELKADRMPIGIFQERNDLFSTKEMAVRKGDTLFMQSDGFEDQFGGVEGKKLKAKAYKELLVKLKDLPMAELRNQLDTFIMEWMNGYAQVDDILVMGIRL